MVNQAKVPAKKYTTLISILRCGYNNATRKELKSVRYFAVNSAMKEMTRYITDYKRNGRAIRKQRREVMLQVLNVFYTYLAKSETGQVCPSMRTIAFMINPNLVQPTAMDSVSEAKEKERAIHATEMAVQRAIHTLEEINVIKIHSYYINEEHAQSLKNPCYFYELMPLSNFSRKYEFSTVDVVGSIHAKNNKKKVTGSTIHDVTVASEFYNKHFGKNKKPKKLKTLQKTFQEKQAELQAKMQEEIAFYKRVEQVAQSKTAKVLKDFNEVLQIFNKNKQTLVKC